MKMDSESEEEKIIDEHKIVKNKIKDRLERKKKIYKYRSVNK